MEKHLAPLRHQGAIESWHDRRILAGSALDAAIDEQINTADVILLLVSASFLASRYCYTIEMQRALERHEAHKAKVVPVILRACDWQATPLGGLLAVPKDGKLITSWANPDEAFADVAKSVRALVESLRNAPPAAATPTPQVVAIAAAPHVQHPRSSNLRLRREFSQLDEDQFLHASFEYITRFFESSLEELQSRHLDVQGQFRRVDANCFTAAIYRHGRRVSECAIQIGGFSRDSGIKYSNSAEARGSSFNELLSVGHDDQALFLKPLGMGSFGRHADRLSEQGAAELLWEILISPLQ